MTETEISAVNRGKLSSVILEAMMPEIDAMADQFVNKLKMMYRDGTFTESKMLAAVAELCALDDLKTRLKSQVRRGQDTLKKEINRDHA